MYHIVLPGSYEVCFWHGSIHKNAKGINRTTVQFNQDLQQRESSFLEASFQVLAWALFARQAELMYDQEQPTEECARQYQPIKPGLMKANKEGDKM
jgi:hypothetical protein